MDGIRGRTIDSHGLNLFLTVLVAFVFGLLVLELNLNILIVFALGVFVVFFFTKTEYVFYFLLASRSIIDIFFNAEVSGGLRVTQVIGALVPSLILFYLIIARYNLFKLNINKIYGIFLFFAIFPIFFTQNLTFGFASWLKLLQGFVVFNMTIFLILRGGRELYQQKANRICWSIIIATVVPYILFIKNAVQGSYIISGGYARYADIGAYPNVFSYYLLAVFPVCLFQYSMAVKEKEKNIWRILMAFMLVTIYMTYTRNVWIGITVLLIVWYLLRKKHLIVFSIIAFCSTAIVFSSDVQRRLNDLYLIFQTKNFFDLDPTLLSSRVGIWQTNLNYFIAKSTFTEKFFGNGFDIADRVAVTFLNQSIPEHSTYLTFLMATGVCGVFMYYSYIFELFREAFKLFRRAKEKYLKNLASIFIAFLFSYVITCAATHMMAKINFQYYFSALAGLVVAANIFEKNKEISLKEPQYAS